MNNDHAKSNNKSSSSLLNSSKFSSMVKEELESPDVAGALGPSMSDLINQSEPDLVMVIPIGGSGANAEAPGFLNEEQVLSNSALTSNGGEGAASARSVFTI